MLNQANDNPAGFDIYVSRNGINWEWVTCDGFGDQFNYGGKVMKSSNNTMYVGTANPFYGCQVWTITEPCVSGGGEDGCFIATVAFSNSDSRQVNILRLFRDRFLITNNIGRRFVYWYYKNGPTSAAFVSRHTLIKIFTRMLLYPIVFVCWMCISGLMGYFSVLLVLCLLFIVGVYTGRKNLCFSEGHKTRKG